MKFKWALIESGAAFEHLVGLLMYRVDPDAKVFGRPGKDAGQDGLSGDGTLVWQAKFHTEGKTAHIFADANAELAKIQRYLDPAHQASKFWFGVTRWRLVTNAECNPADVARWNSKIKPVFAGIGLDAELWDSTQVENLLTQHSDIAEYFFGGETRVFLSIGEARHEYFESSLINARLRGRESALRDMAEFVESAGKRFLLLHGPGAVGKTRLLLDFGEQMAASGAWQVLWGQVESMSASSQWFRAIPRDRPTLLILDEPDRPDVLKILAEQLTSLKSWKVAVGARSPKDPVLSFLHAPSVLSRVVKIPLAALMPDDAAQVAREMLDGTVRAAAAAEIANGLDGFPGWIALAAQFIRKNTILTAMPADFEDLAGRYFHEITESQNILPANDLLSLLRWISLLGGLNREDNAAVEIVAKRSGLGDSARTLALIARQVERRVLFERGARRRWAEVKPDVMRDFILSSWLVHDTHLVANRWRPSAEALGLISSCADGLLNIASAAYNIRILLSVARTEFVLGASQKPVKLLAELYRRLRDAISSTSAERLQAIIQALTDIAFYHPSEAAQFSLAVRSAPIPDEEVRGVFRTRTVGRRDVVYELPWMVFHAAMGAREPGQAQAVLHELYQLTVAEQQLGPNALPNDGKRAGALLERAIMGGPDFWMALDDAAGQLAEQAVRRICASDATLVSEAAAAKALLGAVTSLARMQFSAVGMGVQLTRAVPGAADRAAIVRTRIINLIREKLQETKTSGEARHFLWEMLAEEHSNLCQLWAEVRGAAGELKARVRAEIAEDLAFARSALNAASFDEIAAARPIWQWHAQFDNDQELKAAAIELEQKFTRDPLVAEFGPLVDRNFWQTWRENAKAKAKELATVASTGKIFDFLERADAYLEATGKHTLPLEVAWYLGEVAPMNPSIVDFIQAALGHEQKDWHSDFAALAAASWLSMFRSKPCDDAAGRLDRLLVDCASDTQRVKLLLRVFGTDPVNSERPRRAELERLYAAQDVFFGQGRWAEYLRLLACNSDLDGEGFRRAAEVALANSNPDQILDAVAVMADSLVIRSGKDLDVGLWLLNRLVSVPKIYRLVGNVRHYLDELVRRTRRPRVDWLVEVLKNRVALEQRSDVPYSYLGNEFFAEFVEPVAAANCDAMRPSVETLVDLGVDQGSVGHDMPDIIRKVDPDGVIAPDFIQRRLRGIGDAKEFLWVGRCAGAYSPGSVPWRTTALPIAERAITVPEAERPKYYSVLLRGVQRAFTMGIGDVPAFATSDVKAAEANLEAETEFTLRKFWEWRLTDAQSELERWEDRTEEMKERYEP